MFTGFNELTNEYLMGIRFNNNRDWFQEHKDMYRQNVHEPICALADDLFAKMQDMDKDFMEIPKISRANRDIRFSKNKNPYKECKWFFFRADGKPDIVYARPTYFFEMSPDWWRYGLFYAPTPTGMKNYRKRIDTNPAEFKKIKKIIDKQDVFKLDGEDYKRLFNKDIDKDILSWYQKKYLEITSWHDYSENIFYEDGLTDLVFEGFKLLYPVYKYLDSIR